MASNEEERPLSSVSDLKKQLYAELEGTGRLADDLKTPELVALRGILLNGGTGLDCATHASLRYGLGAREAMAAGCAAAIAQLYVQGCVTTQDEMRIISDACEAIIDGRENALQRLIG